MHGKVKVTTMDIPEEGTSSPTAMEGQGQGDGNEGSDLPADGSIPKNEGSATCDASGDNNGGDSGDEDIDTDDDKPAVPMSPIIPEERRLHAVQLASSSDPNAAGRSTSEEGSMESDHIRPPELEIPKPGDSFQRSRSDDGDSDVYGSDISQHQQQQHMRAEHEGENQTSSDQQSSEHAKSVGASVGSDSKSIPEETQPKLQQTSSDDLMADTSAYAATAAVVENIAEKKDGNIAETPSVVIPGPTAEHSTQKFLRPSPPSAAVESKDEQQISPRKEKEQAEVVIPGPTAEQFTQKFLNPSPPKAEGRKLDKAPLASQQATLLFTPDQPVQRFQSTDDPHARNERQQSGGSGRRGQSPAPDQPMGNSRDSQSDDDDENDESDQIMEMISRDKQPAKHDGESLDNSENSDGFEMEELTRSANTGFYLRQGKFKSESDLARAIKISSVVRPTMPQRSVSSMPRSAGSAIPSAASLLSGAPRPMLGAPQRSSRMATMTGAVISSSDDAPPNSSNNAGGFSPNSQEATRPEAASPQLAPNRSTNSGTPSSEASSRVYRNARSKSPRSVGSKKSRSRSRSRSKDVGKTETDVDPNADIDAALATATYTANAMSVSSSTTGSRRSFGRRGGGSTSSGSRSSGRGSSRGRGSASAGTRSYGNSHGGRMVVVGRGDDGSRRSRVTPVDDDYDDDEKNLEIFEALTKDVMAKTFSTFHETQTTALTRLKFIILAIFILCTIIGCTCVLIIMRNFDSDASNDIYQDTVEQVMDQVSSRWISTMTSLDSYVVTMASVGQLSYANPLSGIISTTWPFVTIPDYAVRASKLQSLNPSILHVGQYHVIRDDQRESWETYTTTSRGWLWQSFLVKERQDEHDRDGEVEDEEDAENSATVDTIRTSDRIHNENGPVPLGPDFYLPLWQSSPLPMNDEFPVYNTDGRTSLGISSSLEPAIPELMNSRVVVGQVRNLPLLSPGEEAEDEEFASNRLETESHVNATNNWLQEILGPDNPTFSEPVSDIYYPITFGAANFVHPQQQENVEEHVHSEGSAIELNSKVVGIGSVTIQWRQFLKDLVPNGIPGMFAVVSNTCGQEFTYQFRGNALDGEDSAFELVDGNSTETLEYGMGLSLDYLGPGDLHDRSYDGMEEIVYLPSLLQPQQGDEYLPRYTGMPLSETSCPYSIHLYPSDLLFDDIATDNPRILMLGAALVFIFCGALFLLYDILVRFSNKGTSYVSLLKEETDLSCRALFACSQTLFSALWRPDNVQLYIKDALSDARPNTAKALTGLNESWRTRYRRSTKKLPADASPDEQEAAEAAAEAEAIAEMNSVHDVLAASIKGDKGDKEVRYTPPVGTIQLAGRRTQGGRAPTAADLFPDTTVMFCHLSGFISWSAKLTPQEVFMLLDKFYSRLDKMANKSKILKVETIGDVYAAVAGLPQPLPEHGLVMARFAADCQNALALITDELAPTLGSGTKNLCLRIGLHSGPVMAGLISGEGTQFQIVGETVDMAERMERTGARNKIHCSQSTATWIRADGMDHWVTPREDKVTVRGKGSIHSYWVEPIVARISSAGSVTDKSASTTGMGEDSSTTATQISKDENSVSSRRRLSGGASVNSAKSSTAKGMLTKVMSPTETSTNPKNKTTRLIDWNVDVLSRLLRNVLAKRTAMNENEGLKDSDKNPNARKYLPSNGAPSSVLKEVVEVIEMPELEARAYFKCANFDLESIELENVVIMQLRAFVTTIEAMYRRHPYHNFEHASHVGMVSIVVGYGFPLKLTIPNSQNYLVRPLPNQLTPGSLLQSCCHVSHHTTNLSCP